MEVHVPTLLSNFSDVLAKIPFPYLFIPHCLIVASWFAPLKNRYLLSYWVGLGGAVGGGVLSALLMQNPAKAPIALFAPVIGNQMFFIWSAAWWLVNYFPGGLIFKLVNFLPIKMFCKASLSVLRIGTIVMRIDQAVVLFPGALAAPLVLGTLGGSGGKLIWDFAYTLTGDLTGLAEFSSPGLPLRSSVFATLLHYGLVYYAQVLSAGQSKALLTALYIAHSMAQELIGLPLDFTHPFATVMHAIANIPHTGPASPHVKVKANAKPASSQSGATSKKEAKKDK